MGYANVAFLGPRALVSAAAAECAAEQGQFWKYHDYLFEEWDQSTRGNFSKASLKELGEELEYDSEAFDECVDSGRTEALVFQDTNFARQLGIRGTPTFFLNGKRFQGFMPYEDIKAMIDDALQAAGQ